MSVQRTQRIASRRLELQRRLVAVIERSKSLTSALEQLLAGRQIDVTAAEWPFQEAPVDKVLNSDSKCHWYNHLCNRPGPNVGDDIARDGRFPMSHKAPGGKTRTPNKRINSPLRASYSTPVKTT